MKKLILICLMVIKLFSNTHVENCKAQTLQSFFHNVAIYLDKPINLDSYENNKYTREIYFTEEFCLNFEKNISEIVKNDSLIYFLNYFLNYYKYKEND